jgi:hypothetical protein
MYAPVSYQRRHTQESVLFPSAGNFRFPIAVHVPRGHLFTLLTCHAANSHLKLKSDGEVRQNLMSPGIPPIRRPRLRIPCKDVKHRLPALQSQAVLSLGILIPRGTARGTCRISQGRQLLAKTSRGAQSRLVLCRCGRTVC